MDKDNKRAKAYSGQLWECVSMIARDKLAEKYHIRSLNFYIFILHLQHTLCFHKRKHMNAVNR